MKGKLTVLAILMGASLLTGCGSNNSKDQASNNGGSGSSSPAIETAYQGIWVSTAYADALVVNEDNIELYKYTSDFCVLQDTFDDLTTEELTRSVALTEDESALTWIAGYGTKDFGAPSRTLEKQVELPASCIGSTLTPESVLTNQELFSLYSQIMDEYYVNFERNNVDWQTLTYELSNSITNSTESLYEAIFTTFQELADTHNKWTTSTGDTILSFTKQTHLYDLVEEFAIANGLSFPLDNSELTEELVELLYAYLDEQFALEASIIQSYSTSDIGVDQTEQVYWFTIGDIGYLHINAMTNYSAASDQEDDLAHTTSALDNINDTLDEALTDLAQTSGLIIDVRYNGGGNDYISLAIASRFTETEYLAYKKYARDGNGVTETQESYISPSTFVQYTDKPIVLLTSEDTASAAETFTLSMAGLDNVTLVGEATHGIFSDVLEWILPGEHLLGLSNEYYVTPDDVWLEGEGVPVDVFVPFFTINDRSNLQDSGIASALALFN